MSNIASLKIELSNKQEEIKPILQKLNELRPIKHKHQDLFQTKFNKAKKLTSEIVELTERIKMMEKF